MPSSSTFYKFLPNQERLARFALGFVLVAALLFVFAPGSFAQTVTTAVAKTDQQPFSALPENLRLRIMLKMIKFGKQDEAERLLQAHPLIGRHSANRTLFLEGLIAKVRKQYKIATKKFRSALASDPKLTMVRAELAHTLFITKQDDGAKHHLQLLSGAAPTPELAKKFDRFIDAVDARRPWRLSAYASIAPSTNFSHGGRHAFIRFPDGSLRPVGTYSRKRSGIGFTGGLNTSYTFPVSKSLSIVFGAGLNLRQYQGKAFDDTIVSQSVSVVRKHKSGQVSFGISASERFSSFVDVTKVKDEFIFEAGPFFSFTQNINNKLQVHAKARHLKTNFKRGDYQSGDTTTLDTRTSFALSQDSVLYALSGGVRANTKREHLDYWSAYGGIALYKEFPLGITTYTQAKVTKKFYDGKFPLFNISQRDTKFDIVASFTKRDFEIFGLAPRLDYIFSTSKSNTPFANFTNHGTSVTFTKAF